MTEKKTTDVVTYSPNELIKEEGYQNFIYYLTHKKELQNFEKKFRQATLDWMKENKQQFYENDNIRVVYKKGSVKRVVDNDKLKEQGLYEMFLKDSVSSESVEITLK